MGGLTLGRRRPAGAAGVALLWLVSVSCGGSAASPASPAPVGPPVTARISPTPLIGTVVKTTASAVIVSFPMDVTLTDASGRGALVTGVSTIVTTTYSSQGITTTQSVVTGSSTAISIPPSGSAMHASPFEHGFQNDGGIVTVRVEVKGSDATGRAFSTSSTAVALTLPLPANER